MPASIQLGSQLGSLRGMLGSYAPKRLEDVRALQERQGAIMSPYNQAIADARASAISNALTAAQGSGNAMLARRTGNQQAARAAAPLLAQRAAAQAGLAQQEIADAQRRREQNQIRADRFLAAGLQGGASLLGGLTSMFGGGSQAPGAGGGMMGATPGGFQAGQGVVTGSYQRPPQAAPQAAPQGLQLQQPQLQAPQQGGGFNLGNMAGQLAPMASFIPGYGPLIGAGLGGLGALFGGR